MRSVLLTAAAAVMMNATAAMADNKSDCQNRVAMIRRKRGSAWRCSLWDESSRVQVGGTRRQHFQDFDLLGVHFGRQWMAHDWRLLADF
jgi:hypothetical protein